MSLIIKLISSYKWHPYIFSLDLLSIFFFVWYLGYGFCAMTQNYIGANDNSIENVCVYTHTNSTLIHITYSVMVCLETPNDIMLIARVNVDSIHLIWMLVIWFVDNVCNVSLSLSHSPSVIHTLLSCLQRTIVSSQMYRISNCLWIIRFLLSRSPMLLHLYLSFRLNYHYFCTCIMKISSCIDLIRWYDFMYSTKTPTCFS